MLTRLIDFFRSLWFVSFPQPLSRFAKKSLLWVPDFQDLEMPDFFPVTELEKRRKAVLTAIDKDYIFYFSSFYALKQFEHHYGQSAKVAGVVRFTRPPNTGGDLSELELPFSCTQCISEGFIYLPNQWWKHKNHLFFLEAYKEYLKKGGSLHLVLTGSSSDWRNPLYKKFLEELIISNLSVHNLGMIPIRKQEILFDRARCLVQPSLYEGWSTTLEEAISSGLGIIASSIPVHHEQLDGIENVKFFDVSSKEDLVEALMTPPARTSISNALLLHEKRWQRFKNELLDVIHEATKQLKH